MVGDADGLALGTSVGVVVGALLGTSAVGEFVGCSVGEGLGLGVGSAVGSAVGEQHPRYTPSPFGQHHTPVSGMMLAQDDPVRPTSWWREQSPGLSGSTAS